MCTCMHGCVYMHECAYMYECASLYVCACGGACVCMFVSAHMCMYMHECACLCVCTCVGACVRVCAQMCMCTCVHGCVCTCMSVLCVCPCVGGLCAHVCACGHAHVCVCSACPQMLTEVSRNGQKWQNDSTKNWCHFSSSNGAISRTLKATGVGKGQPGPSCTQCPSWGLSLTSSFFPEDRPRNLPHSSQTLGNRAFPLYPLSDGQEILTFLKPKTTKSSKPGGCE